MAASVIGSVVVVVARAVVVVPVPLLATVESGPPHLDARAQMMRIRTSRIEPDRARRILRRRLHRRDGGPSARMGEWGRSPPPLKSVTGAVLPEIHSLREPGVVHCWYQRKEVVQTMNDSSYGTLEVVVR